MDCTSHLPSTHRYVNKYISVQDREYRALKLLGQIYSNTGHHFKAINYYKRYVHVMCVERTCMTLPVLLRSYIPWLYNNGKPKVNQKRYCE